MTLKYTDDTLSVKSGASYLPIKNYLTLHPLLAIAEGKKSDSSSSPIPRRVSNYKAVELFEIER